MNTDLKLALKPMYDWNTLPWKQFQKNVFKLQKRIYRAQENGNRKAVNSLERLLMKSYSAKCLAIRQVTQENQGKKTAGVDGVKSLEPFERMNLLPHLELNQKASPLRRVRIPKPNSTEERCLGIPTMKDRALQALAKMGLEPQWEAQFEANSYGFRPGRSAWDAIGMVYVAINQKPKWVLDTDIAKCFDRISHEALLKKLNTWPKLRQQIKAWLKAGVMDTGELFPTEAGTPQGGVVSPLLANIALHGIEEELRKGYKKANAPIVVRYADDLVVLHPKREVIEQAQERLKEWLIEMGLEMKASKTRITHTLEEVQGTVGFDFLGYKVRQYRVKKSYLGFKTLIKPSEKSQEKHHLRLREVIKEYRLAPQERLIKGLNPVIRGWSNYYSTVCSKESYNVADYKLKRRLKAWGRYRHTTKRSRWIQGKYWQREGGKWCFKPKRVSAKRLYFHNEVKIKRHAKVQGRRSPYEEEWMYWARRRGSHPEVSTRVARLLKKQEGKCARCHLYCREGESLAVDHRIPTRKGGKNSYDNWQLLHKYCHDQKTTQDRCEYA